MTKRSFSVVLLAFLAVSLFASCSQQTRRNCVGSSSVAAFVVGLRQGLSEVSQNEFSQFRLDTLDVYETVSSFVKDKDKEIAVAAKLLQQDLADFVRFLDYVQWDVSKVDDSTIAVLLVKKLSDSSALSNANQIELALINKCGVSSSVPGSLDSSLRLPDVSFPPVNDTDPPANITNDESEATAIGSMIATVFGLTLSQNQIKCLGEALSGVYDATSADANMAQYQMQFQKAFDTCAIAFTVPTD